LRRRRARAKSDTSTTANPPFRSAKYALLPSLLTVSEWRPPVGFWTGAGKAGNRVYPCSPLKSVTGGWPFTTDEMSQTENGQLGEPPRVGHVELAFPAKCSAHSGFRRVLPEEELVRVDVELVEQLRSRRVLFRDVVEAEVRDRRLRAVVQLIPDAAVRVEHHQEVPASATPSACGTTRLPAHRSAPR
jgi:hypothetical protein